jgi:hypothetical protein
LMALGITTATRNFFGSAGGAVAAGAAGASVGAAVGWAHPATRASTVMITNMAGIKRADLMMLLSFFLNRLHTVRCSFTVVQ